MRLQQVFVGKNCSLSGANTAGLKPFTGAPPRLLFDIVHKKAVLKLSF